MKKFFVWFWFLVSFCVVLQSKDLSDEFDKCMSKEKPSYKKKYSYKPHRLALEKLKNIYLKNKNQSLSKKPRIPKKIHQIWVGPKPVPKLLKKLQKTWKEKHPDWEYKLWTNEDVKTFNLYNKKLYDKTVHVREKANLLRYEILYRYGGLYVDADFECLKSFDDLNYRYDFYLGVAPNNAKTIVNNALIGSIPGHPILERIIKNINPNSKVGPLKRSGVWYFSNIVVRLIDLAEGINIAFPMKYFYSYPLAFSDNSQKAEKYLNKESMAIHYWAWTSGGWKRSLKKHKN